MVKDETQTLALYRRNVKFLLIVTIGPRNTSAIPPVGGEPVRTRTRL